MASSSTSREARGAGRQQQRAVAVLFLVVLLLLPSLSLSFLLPALPSSSNSLSSLRPRPRARGGLVCKKGASSSSSGGGGGAAKGFGFGTKKDPKVDKYKYSGRLRPGEVSASRLVPADIMRPDYALDGYVCVRVCFPVCVRRRIDHRERWARWSRHPSMHPSIDQPFNPTHSKPKARDPPLPWMIEVKTPQDIAGACTR